MRKLIVLFTLTACLGWPATWYATSSSVNINQASLWVPTSTGSCTGSGTALTWGSQANGDVFNANGCTALAVNVDPGAATGASAGVCGSVTVTVTLTTDASNGGAFTYATATNIVIHANITATKTLALSISGATGGGTICGVVTGGTVASQYGVSDTHTAVTMYQIGNIFGGTAARGYYWNSGTGALNVTGNITGGGGSNTEGLLNIGLAGSTVIGICIGGTGPTGAGCSGASGPVTVTGNAIASPTGQGVAGKIYFTPSTTSYILMAKDSSYTTGVIDSHAIEIPANPGVTNVKSGVNYGSLTGTLAVTSTHPIGQ